MDNNISITHVVLTGGVGSRLWPLSRKSQPKQYLELFDGKSLLEMTIARNANVADKVLIVGNVENYQLSCKVMEKFNAPHSHIVEATPRNTAAAIAFAAFNCHPDDILIVTPSDHLIEGEKEYIASLQEAIALAKRNFLVTFGIQPSRPETGYGYIEYRGDDVLAFHEKPNLEKAVSFIEKDTFLWNSGMFCFKAGLFLEELKKQEPTVYNSAHFAWMVRTDNRLDYDASLKIPSISVDYAVMERSKNIKVVPSYFEWSDLGSFESVYDYLVQGGHPVDSKGNIAIGSTTHISFVGVENCLLVSTPDALLVLQKENSQEVKNIYKQLESVSSPLL